MTDLLFALILWSCGDPETSGFVACVEKQMACLVEGKAYEATRVSAAMKVVGACIVKVRGGAK